MPVLLYQLCETPILRRSRRAHTRGRSRREVRREAEKRPHWRRL